MSNKFFTDYFKYIQEGLDSVNHADLIKASDMIKAVSKEVGFNLQMVSPDYGSG